MKKRLFNLAKIIISLLLIAYLAYKYWDDIKNFFLTTTLDDIDFPFLVLAALMHLTGLYISSIRWKILLKMQKVDAGINYLNGSLLVGIFLNNFLPGSIGGDTYRAYDTSQLKNSSWAKSITVLLVERGTGIIALIGFTFISLFMGFKLTGFNKLFLIVIVLLVLCIIFIIFLLNPRLLKPLNFVFKIRFMKKIKDKLKSLVEAFSEFKNNKPGILGIIFLSFIMQFNVIIHYYFVALALNIEISFISFLFMVPIITLIAMIPISIGGLGIRENTTVYFLGALGVSSAKTVAFPLLILALLLIISLAGGIIFLIKKPKISS